MLVAELQKAVEDRHYHVQIIDEDSETQKD